MRIKRILAKFSGINLCFCNLLKIFVGVKSNLQRRYLPNIPATSKLTTNIELKGYFSLINDCKFLKKQCLLSLLV